MRPRGPNSRLGVEGLGRLVFRQLLYAFIFVAQTLYGAFVNVGRLPEFVRSAATGRPVPEALRPELERRASELVREYRVRVRGSGGPREG